MPNKKNVHRWTRLAGGVMFAAGAAMASPPSAEACEEMRYRSDMFNGLQEMIDKEYHKYNPRHISTKIVAASAPHLSPYMTRILVETTWRDIGKVWHFMSMAPDCLFNPRVETVTDVKRLNILVKRRAMKKL